MDALANEAQALLREDGFLRGSKLTVAAEGENLVITGSVPTFHHKQMAQEVIRRLFTTWGVSPIQNRVVVEKRE